MYWPDELASDSSAVTQTKKTRQWFKARGRISSANGPQSHLSALAYISDSYFVGTVARVHNLVRLSSFEPERGDTTFKSSDIAHKEEENSEVDGRKPRVSIGMMVSLDHTIYFHHPREIKADEWMLSENESPWSGDGRGLVFQRIWNKEGVLVASCVQEVSESFGHLSSLLCLFPLSVCTLKTLKFLPRLWCANDPQGLVRLAQDDPAKSKL